ncbi:MAG TPA: GAF domain-containing sensor histidine kinase [Anaerolineae bacterium]|nr:GAF domain-containing sensor histidine kinase [Anaerolineae bacterium]
MTQTASPQSETGTGPLRETITSLQRQTARLQRILEISRGLTTTLDIDQLLGVILEAATELTNTEAASIMLLDERTGALVFAASTGTKREDLANIRVPLEGSIAGTILKQRAPLVVGDVTQDPRHFNQAAQRTGFLTRSILGVPMTIKDRPIGVLEALNKQGDDYFGEEDIQVLTTFANQAAVAIENARLVAALRKAYQKLNDLDRRKSDFIAIASHELRTPLNLILGYAAMLREDAHDATATQLEGVLKGAEQLRSIIDDMINLQYVDTGEAMLNATRFRAADLIDAVLNECQDMVQAKDQLVRIDLSDPALLIHADWDKTRLALNNLVTNASKFTPPQGRIEISGKVVNGEVQVCVRDNGIGIPRKDVERIFERFYQVEPHIARKHGGLGLGLAITKSIVELHGGRVWCESVEGKGSRFTFALPADGPKRVKRGTTPLRVR